jgi:Family of unknown function (DUF6299)
VGSQGNLQSVRCISDGYVDFFAAAGTRYYVLVTGGGLLSISFYNWPNVPVPTLDITVDSFGRVDNKTGNAAMSGTYTCTLSSNITISVFAHQNGPANDTGRFFEFGLACDGAVHTWTAHINPQYNNFAAGSTAMAAIYASACSNALDLCASSGFDEQTVKWRGGLKDSPFQ